MVSRATATFGALLRRFRLAASLSQEALAERANISASTIAALERGRHNNPRPETVSLLAEALRLDTDDRAALALAAGGMAQAEDAASAERPPDAASTEPFFSLPTPPTALVGREREEAAITHLLLYGPARLLTLTGPGGVGKTRLAAAVARTVQSTFADGTVFVDLSGLYDSALVGVTIAQALRLREDGAQDVRAQLVAFLGARRLLLILDNFEQVVDAAPFVAELVATAPRLSVLVTSRTALQVRAEQQFRVPPLSIPAVAGQTYEEIAGSAAVQLFVARARAVQPRFQLDAANSAAVAEICRRLDGLPLALELAAARIALLPPTALLRRLEQRLPLLTTGARDLPTRQRTLRTAIDWSYSLLDAAEQQLFARLGAFVGGASFEAVAAVCDPDGALDVLDGLTSLSDKSLLAQAGDSADPRVTMLETLREYARERLAASGEITETRRAHAMYFMEQAEASLSAFKTHEAAWLQRWEREHDNVRAALSWAHECGETEMGLRLAAIVWRFWYVRGYLSEGRTWFDSLLEAHGVVAPTIRANALRGASALASQHGDLGRAETWGQQALALYREMGESLGIADILNLLGNVAREGSQLDRAADLYEESRALYQAFGDTIGVAAVLNNLGTMARYQGALGRAATLHEESLALRRAAGDAGASPTR